MRLRSFLPLIAAFALPGCLDDDCTATDPCQYATAVSYHANPVATTSAAGRFVAYDDHDFMIQGALLGTPPAPLGPGDSLAVASDGSDHVLLVREHGRLLSRNVSDRTSHLIAAYDDMLSPRAASIASASDGYVIAWTPESYGPGTTFVARLARSGELIGGPWQVSATKEVDRGLAVAADSTGIIVVWTETDDAVDPTTGVHYRRPVVHLRRIANDGTLGPEMTRDQAVAGSIAGGDGGFVLASITDSETVIAEYLDGELAPVGAPIAIASAYDDVGIEPDVAVAGKPGVFAVQYTSALGTIQGMPGRRVPYAKIIVGDTIGSRIELGSAPGQPESALLTGYDGVFHALWNEYRMISTGPDTYDEYLDLFQAKLRPDGGMMVETIF